MKVLLVGYGEMMQSLALGILASKHEIVGVLRQENILHNKLMRSFYDYLKPSSDYIFIKTHKLKDIDVRSVNSNKFHKIIKDLKADIVLVGSWSEKFSAQTLNILPNGFINVHPSLLPEYRGPNPYLQVVLHNEEVSGITFHLMDVGYDSGSILYQKEIPVLPNDTGGSLKMRTCEIAKNEIPFLLDNLKERIINQRSQTEPEATYYSRLSLKDAIIDFRKENSTEIARRIRALSPWINCYLPINNKFYSFQKYKITKEKVAQEEGTIVDKTDNSIFIVCKDKVVMKFSNLKIVHTLSGFISKFFWNRININDKAL